MQPHRMDLVSTYPDGSQEFYCSVCGRRFIMHWPPAYSRVMLCEGDPTAPHTGATGGLAIDTAAVESMDDHGENSGPAVDPADPRLSVFTRFVKGK